MSGPKASSYTVMTGAAGAAIAVELGISAVALAVEALQNHLEQERLREEAEAAERQRLAEERRHQRLLEQQRREALRHAWQSIADDTARVAELQRQYQAARMRYPQLSVTLSVPPNELSPDSDEASVLRHAGVLHELFEQGQHALTSTLQQLRVEDKLVNAIASLCEVKQPAQTAQEVLQAYQALRPVAPADQTKPAETPQTILRQLLERLGTQRTQLPAGLQQLIIRIEQEQTSWHSENLLLELRLQLQRWHEALEQQSLEQQRARQLLDHAPVALEGDELVTWQNLQRQLFQIANGQQRWNITLEQQLTAFYVDLEERMKQEFAARTVANALEEMGYEVASEATVTLFSEGGELFLQKPGMDKHYVALRVEPAAHQMVYRVVRMAAEGESSSSEDRIRDQEVEERWCQDHGKLLHNLNERGMSVKLLKAKAAGSVDVQVVTPVQLGRQATHRSQQARLRQQTLSNS